MRRPYFWTEARQTRLLYLWTAGVPVDDIRTELQISYFSLYKQLGVLGLKRRAFVPELSLEECARQLTALGGYRNVTLVDLHLLGPLPPSAPLPRPPTLARSQASC